MNVLIVDDDTALRRSLGIVLTERGHHVTCCGNSISATAHVKRHPHIDVFLLDYIIGETDGEELLNVIADDLPPECRTIMITGHFESIRSTERLRQQGVVQFLAKPLDLREVCELIEQNNEAA